MIRYASLFVLASLIAVFACGDDSTSTSTLESSVTPLNPDVCSLLTQAEIQKIAGIDSAPVQNRDRPSFPSYECYWGGAYTDSVDVVLIRQTAGKTPQRDAQAEEIDGLGEYAQYSAHFPPILEVYDGAWLISVSPITPELTKSGNGRDASIELARSILNRLK